MFMIYTNLVKILHNSISLAFKKLKCILPNKSPILPQYTVVEYTKYSYECDSYSAVSTHNFRSIKKIYIQKTERTRSLSITSSKI